MIVPTRWVLPSSYLILTSMVLFSASVARIRMRSGPFLFCELLSVVS